MRFVPAILLFALFFLAFQLRVKHEMVDFGVYRQAAERVTRAEALYQSTDGHYQFKYLPAFAVLAAPLAWLAESDAKVVWFALSAGALVLLVRFSVAFLPARRHRPLALVGLTVLFMAKFYAHELVLGQVNILFALLAVAGIAALQVELPVAAGVLFGLAVAIKPYGLIFAPWLLVAAPGASGRWRAAGGFAAIVAALLALPSLVYGVGGAWALMGDWWRTVSESTAPNLLGADNVSFAAMWAKWIGVGAPASALASVTTVAAVAIVADLWRRRAAIGEPEYLEVSALLLLVPLVSPQGWDYVLLVATPAVAVIADRLAELPRAWRIGLWIALLVMGLTSFDLLGRAAYGQFMALSVITLCALGLLAGLHALRTRALA